MYKCGGWWTAAHQSFDESICNPIPAHMESIQVTSAAAEEEEEDSTRELRKMVPRRPSLLFLLFFLLDNTTLSATKSSRGSTNPQSKTKDQRPRILLLLSTTMRKKDHITNTLTVGIRQSLLHDNGRSKWNQLRNSNKEDQVIVWSSLTIFLTANNTFFFYFLLLQQEAHPAAGQKNSFWMLLCVWVWVCVCLSLSMCKCLEFSLLFPHFFTGLLIITTANGTTIGINGNRNIATQAWKRWRRRNFLLHQKNGCKSNSFCFAKNYQNNMQYMKKPKRKSSFWFFWVLWVVL